MALRKRENALKPTPPLTFLKCSECGTDNSRPFKQNDYVFKVIEDEKCPKCGSTRMVVVNIYVPEKKQEA